MPLTISGDTGCLVGLGVCAITTKIWLSDKSDKTIDGYSAAFASTGLCLSYLIRSGFITGSNSESLIAGDFLSGIFTTLCAFGWWRLCASQSEHIVVRSLAGALGIAGTLFILLSLLPANIARVIACTGLPLGMSLCFFPLVIRKNKLCPVDTQDPKNTQIKNTSAPNFYPNENKRADSPACSAAMGMTSSTNALPRIIVITIAFSCFVVNLAMALFPVCLYHEESPLLASLVGTNSEANTPIGTLTQPAVICAVLIIIFATILYIFSNRKSVPLAPLYYIGFAMTAFDYLAFPYHFPGGTPLAVAESGRIIIALFIVVMLLRLLENKNSDISKVFLQAVAIAFISMIIADVLAIAVQMQPDYDYSDFRFRTAFAGIGTAVLVVLLLGPLPRVNATLASLASAADMTNPQSDSDLSLEEHFEQACANFAIDHKLSSRESEIFMLIVNGRDVPYIERKLVLTKSTVKTHIKHIYEKCGVSSRQDLLDMFEDYRA